MTIRYFCDECGKAEFKIDHLEWHEKNGNEALICNGCQKQRDHESGMKSPKRPRHHMIDSEG